LEAYQNLSNLFKLLAHPARVAILVLLREGEECVCHMTTILGLRQAYVSQQLMALRQAGLVIDRRDGWNIYYRVTRPELYPVLDAACAALDESGRKAQAPGLGGSRQTCTYPRCQGKVEN
jgi:DNA-binding transcriptional ArsR family regulator